MNIEGLVHVNINCTNYARSKTFYEMLGFEEVWQVPATNSAEVNAAVGMNNYQVTGAIMKLKGVEPVLIDLLQWHEPEDHSPPYAICIVGLARLALRSSDIQADYDYLVAQGVEVLSPPPAVYASANSGSRFFCFKDPDGTFLGWLSSFNRCR